MGRCGRQLAGKSEKWGGGGREKGGLTGQDERLQSVPQKGSPGDVGGALDCFASRVCGLGLVRLAGRGDFGPSTGSIITVLLHPFFATTK